MPKLSPAKELLAAIEAASVPAVRDALAKGASPDTKKGKQSALELAFRYRLADEGLLALIEAGADLASAKGMIVWAATQPVPILEKLLAAGASPNAESFAGRPVQVAARAGLLPQVKCLLAAGADPNAGTMIGNALTDAVRNGHAEVALELLRSGATPAAAERFGPLLAILIELGDTAVVRAWLDGGADPNARYTLRGPHSRANKQQAEASRTGIVEGLKALTTAVPSALAESDDSDRDDESFEDFEKRINDQLDAKVGEATRVRFSGATPLMIAAAEGSLELVELLLGRGADANAVDDSGRSALAIAEASGQRAVAERLRTGGAAAAAAVAPPQALMLAAESGDAAGVEAALKRGAPVDGHDTRASAEGKTALVLAVEHGHLEASKRLIALGANPALKAKTSPHNMRALLENESQERTPLHVAAAFGRDEIVKLLLDAKAPLEARDECRETPLHLAATANRLSTVRLLLERGAEVDPKGRDGMTPLLYAAARGHAKVGEALLAAGADARAATRAKESALHYAVSGKCVPLVRALVAHGANPRAPNKYGSTPLERGGHVDAIAAIFSAPPEGAATKRAKPAPKPKRRRSTSG